jgi:hypothetical protein
MGITSKEFLRMMKSMAMELFIQKIKERSRESGKET